MALRPIVLYPDPVLLRPTREVESIDEEVRSLARDMAETMYAARGIGLAANQVGVAMRMFVVDLTAGEEHGHLEVFVNPRVLTTSGVQTGEEGCLSFPDITFDVTRAEAATVEAIDLEGRSFERTATGLMARVMLHEIEHLDGQVFLRNLSTLKRDFFKRKIRKRISAGDWASPVEV